MAARVGPSVVSYGIGVQNRYSAFLEDEDGFPLPIVAPTNIKRSQESGSAKQKGQVVGAQKSPGSTVNKVNGRSGGPISNGGSRQDGQKKIGQSEGHKHIRDDGKRQQSRSGQQSLANFTQAPRQANSKHVNSNSEVNTANKYTKNQSNGNQHYQTTGQQNKENNEFGRQQGRSMNGNQRLNRSRHFDDKKAGGHSVENNGVVSSLGSQSNEDEKHRRHQKRVMDLKYKDSEKKEARRQQLVSAANEQSNSDGQTDHAQGENDAGHRGQRNRRDGPRGPGESGRNSGVQRVRVRRQEGDSNGEQRDGQQPNRPGGAPRKGDRPQRTRNGFGAGSRANRNSRSDDGRQERPKPIPNFSDKSDFPSLAS